MNIPTVSVIMSVYNTPSNYLIESIDSILTQSYTDFEFIIIDDGSNKETKDILYKYSADDRIVIIVNSENRGLTYNLNKGITLSKGKYIARMDADDVAERDRFLEQVRFLDKNKDISVAATYYYLLENGKKYKPKGQATGPDQNRARWFFTNNGVMHASVMMRASVINTKNGFCYDTHFRKTQDYDLWTRVSRENKIAIIPQLLMSYRISENQISKKNAEEQMSFYDEIILRQVCELYDDVTEEQKTIHLNICRGRKNLNSKVVYAWSKALKKKNKEKKDYQEDSFNYYAGYYCYRNSIKSIKSLGDFFYSFALVIMYLTSVPRFYYSEKRFRQSVVY